MPRVYDLHDVQLPIDSGTVGEFVFKDNAKVVPPPPMFPHPLLPLVIRQIFRARLRRG